MASRSVAKMDDALLNAQSTALTRAAAEALTMRRWKSLDATLICTILVRTSSRISLMFYSAMVL